MTVVTHDRLRPLLVPRSGPCISIYMPTILCEAGQNLIRFKNSLREAQRLLSGEYSTRDTHRPGVDALVGFDRAPVILAGVDYYLPIYREVSRLKNLASGIVRGGTAGPNGSALTALASSIATC